MPVSERTYQQIILEDPEGQWELHGGRLREKPSMTFAHNRTIARLGSLLTQQLDWDEFDVRINAGWVRRPNEAYYIPDVFVVPVSMTEQFRDRSDILEVYDAPLPLVVEVWSPSTGDYDVDAKLPEYRRRGDLEVWRLHPYERTLTAWRRQPDGSYTEELYRGGTVQPASLPNVSIDLDLLLR
ncbi:MAG: Uma2 family endonuclease [Chloroflexota bacterium]|nr:Uma2 family endonuclease [Chloroflexota bacterium]